MNEVLSVYNTNKYLYLLEIKANELEKIKKQDV